MTRARPSLLCTALVVSSLLATAAWTTAQRATAGNQTVRIALDYSANVNYLGIYVAQEKGYFARQHITAQDHPIREHACRDPGRERQHRPRHQLPAGRDHQPRKGPRIQGGRGARPAEHDRSRSARVVGVHTAGTAERQALRRLRHRERPGHRDRDPEERRRGQAFVQAGRAEHRRLRRARQAPDPVHGGVRRDRRRHRPRCRASSSESSPTAGTSARPGTTRTSCSWRATARSRSAQRRCGAR